MTNALYGAALIPLITGIIQVAKLTGMPSQLAPAVALLLGLGAGIASTVAAAVPHQPNWGQAAVLGLTFGLAAAGLYSSSKTAIGGVGSPTYVPVPPLQKGQPAVSPKGPPR